MTKKSALAFVIGNPIAHSRSPQIFSYLAKITKHNLNYYPLQVEKNELDVTYKFFQRLSVTGMNVTLPYKESIISYLTKLDPKANAIGAVNVVKFTKQGSIGFNTDIYGILETFKEQKIKISGAHVVVYGAGGAANAVVYALGKSKANTVYIINRTKKKASHLARKMNSIFNYTKYEARSFSEKIKSDKVSLYINATAIGVGNKVRKKILPKNVDPNAFVFDVNYLKRGSTSFLTEAKKRKLSGVDGKSMLIWQALKTWEIWFGSLPNKKKTKDALMKEVFR